MDKKFIDQIHLIVMSNISDEKFGAPKLSSLLGLSQSQTLKKIRALTGKSVNQYIRELRLKKATNLIKETDLTNAEISYKVGFSSQSYFNKTFRKQYGITPGEYKTQNVNLAELASKKAKNKIRNYEIIKKVFYVVSIAVLFVVGYFIINTTSAKIELKPNSIAVLPFVDMSPEDNQWFSDGISDNILTYLSQIKELTVISFTSSSTYMNTDKKIPEIAKELGVSYILEGSVTVYEDKIKINTQLINANDEHVWSEDYIVAFEDVINIQQNISEQIVKELEITLNQEEEIAIKKYPTQNMEAYQLVIKGRSIASSRNNKDLVKSIELYKKATKLDTNYAEAYAELAQSHFLLINRRGYNFEWHINKARFYVEKALSIDPNCFRAYAVKARIFDYEEKWDLCKENFEKAIALNPNDAQVRLQYVIYLRTNPNKDIENGFIQLQIAQQLDPFSKNVNNMFFEALLRENKFEELEEYFNKWRFVFSEEDQFRKESLIKVYKNKDWTEEIRFYETEIEKDPNNVILYRLLAGAYNKIMNDDLKAIEYFKKGCELDSTNPNNILIYYVEVLLEAEKFKEANKIMRSKNYKSVVTKKSQLELLFFYHYRQKNYKKAQEVLNDSMMVYENFYQAHIYAQLKDRHKLDSILKDNRDKAVVYAILKEKDSMYHYLNSFDVYQTFFLPHLNSLRAFDPYRKEERYKAFLRKNYFPITHWNE